MASKKQSKSSGALGFSWMKLLIGGSFALNVALISIFASMAFTTAMDRMLIQEGLGRYCLSSSDYLYAASTKETKALRDFTCVKGNAQPYYENAIKSYISDYYK